MIKQKPDNEISVREAGRRGGEVTKTRYAGTDFYRRIGAIGGEVTKSRWGHLFAEFGRRGGRPRRLALNDESTGERDQ